MRSTQRIGRFELAHRGTVFLDEVGEIPLELQPKLLRVLQEREFERLGSSRTLHSDARLIAATNRDLAALAAEQKFREDLFYRLNVFPITVPPLRERREDIPMLVRHFAQQFARRMKKTIETIPTETMEALTRYDWPGNIRELQNLIERAVILSAGQTLDVPVAALGARQLAGGEPRGRRDARGGRSPPHHRRARAQQLGDRRSERGRRAAGDQAIHAAVPHAQAGDRPAAAALTRAPPHPGTGSRRRRPTRQRTASAAHAVGRPCRFRVSWIDLIREARFAKEQRPMTVEVARVFQTGATDLEPQRAFLQDRLGLWAFWVSCCRPIVWARRTSCGSSARCRSRRN